jgi:lipoprotein NlpD
MNPQRPLLSLSSLKSFSIWALLALSAATTSSLTGCSSISLNRAPVEDRGAPTAGGPATTGAATSTVATAIPAATAKPLPGAENAGKPGYYTVKPGDTMIRIGLETGQNWKDVTRWNGLENPNLIEVGQVLRVIAPGTSADVTPGAFIPRPVAPPAPAVASSIPPAGTRTAAAPAAAASAPAAPVAAAPTPAASSAGDDEVAWIWPTAGGVIAGFDEAKNKGLDISGKAGDPVLAAGDGRVVYAGSGLRGYGNLVILKHNNTYLTAYAHNQTLLVKEDQTVRKGQKIAEMGQSDADRVKLHFEIRRQGKPVDPARFLPAR